MKKDAVDEILEQWTEERPELDTASLGVVIRVMTLYKAFYGQAREARTGQAATRRERPARGDGIPDTSGPKDDQQGHSAPTRCGR